MHRLAAFAVSAAVFIAASVGTASASSQRTSGEDSAQLDTAAQWFQGQRAAPNDAVNPNAYAALLAQKRALTTFAGTWNERTAGGDFSDDPNFIDPTSNFSNSGAGDRWVSGRITALAIAPNGDLWAGGADGGVWEWPSGATGWTPMGDSLSTLSIGSIAIVGSGSTYTVYAGTGEANGSGDSYAGTGVLSLANGSTTWSQVGATPSVLNGALTFRLTYDAAQNTLYAATSHGLYRYNLTTAPADWQAVLVPDTSSTPSNSNLHVKNWVTDVLVKPSGQIVTVVGYRGGSQFNGIYVSNTGDPNSFTFIANPQGWVPAKSQGRVTIAQSSAGDRLYAIVQSASLFQKPTNGNTILAGIFESQNGNPAGPWTKIADSSKLSNAFGSSLKLAVGGKGYQPGVQAWYNQFLAVDPSDKDHLYVGLEEVYETRNAGVNWVTVAPYWNFTSTACSFSYTPFEGNCNHDQAHSDQHAVALNPSTGKLYIGNDGGVYSRSLSDHRPGHWNDLNQSLDTLQYYSATEGGSTTGPDTIWGGMQDNGSNMVFPTITAGNATDDNGNPITAAAVQPFGGDGGYTVVDPTNPDNVITEYVDLIAFKSTDGGANWHYIAPSDPNPRFITPIERDATNPDNFVTGGAFVWFQHSDTGVAGVTSKGWQQVYDLRTVGAGSLSGSLNQLTAVDTTTDPGTGVTTIWAAWCGSCNPSFSTGGGFHGGLVELNNNGTNGAWQVVQNIVLPVTQGAVSLPNRYVTAVKIDPADPNHVYVGFSGYSRHWIAGPDDPGVGHVFQFTDGTWSETNDQFGSPGALPDVPVNDILVENGSLIVGTDFGAYISQDGGATWQVFGNNLPNVVVDQLTLGPNNTVLAATHGRGAWTISAP